MTRTSEYKLKIREHDIFYFVGWVLLFIPPIFFHISGTLSSFIRLSNLLYTVLLIVLFVRSGNRIRRSVTAKYLLLLSIWELFVCVFQSPDQISGFFFNMLLPPIEVFFLISMIYSGEKGDARQKFQSLIFMSKMYIVVNLLTIVLFPKGIITTNLGASVERANWFLGSKNNQTNYLLLSSIVLLLFSDTKKDKRRSIVYIALALFSIVVTDEFGLRFMGGSSTGIVAIGFVFMVTVLFYFLDEKVHFNIKPFLVYVISIGVNVVLITGTTVSAIKYIIEDVLGKNTTFSNRTYIWERVLYYIYNNPYIGYGEQQLWFAVRLSNKLDGTTYVYNMFLKLILDFGIVGFVLLSIPMLRLKKSESRFCEVLLIAFTAFFIAGLMNEIGLEYLFFIMFMYEISSSRAAERSAAGSEDPANMRLKIYGNKQKRFN